MLCFVFDVLVMNDIKPLIISNIEAEPTSLSVRVLEIFWTLTRS